MVGARSYGLPIRGDTVPLRLPAHHAARDVQLVGTPGTLGRDDLELERVGDFVDVLESTGCRRTGSRDSGPGMNVGPVSRAVTVHDVADGSSTPSSSTFISESSGWP